MLTQRYSNIDIDTNVFERAPSNPRYSDCAGLMSVQRRIMWTNSELVVSLLTFSTPVFIFLPKCSHLYDARGCRSILSSHNYRLIIGLL